MPIAYLDAVHSVKHVRPGTRSHGTERVRVAVPVEIPEISASEAPAAVTRGSGEGACTYRAWEGGLFAPVLSTKGYVRTSWLADRDANILLGNALSRSGVVMHGFKVPERSGVRLGRILSDTRDEAIALARRVGANLVCLDGLLHERTHPPAWTVRREQRAVVDDPRPARIRVALLDSARPGEVGEGNPGALAQLFSIGRRDDALACAEAFAREFGLVLEAPEPSVVIHDAEACAIDDLATSAAHALAGAANPAPSQDFQRLSDEVLTAFMAVRRAAWAQRPLQAHPPADARRLLGALGAALAAHPELPETATLLKPGLVAQMRALTAPFVLRYDRFEAGFRAGLEEDMDEVALAFGP